MQFRDLKRQYKYLQDSIDNGIDQVLNDANFIQGSQVEELERKLAEYVGCKHCITCANGTDALQLALMVWNVKEGDAVFVPDFTFFSSGEVVAAVGATPIFVDVYDDTYNINIELLEKKIGDTIREGLYVPKAIIAVDLFGQPADYDGIYCVAKKYGLLVLEDGAQGFGGKIREKRACSFGDISTTSFFPAKPLGCYGDGGAIFTDNDSWAEMIRSYKVHGKGSSKYDNVRVGMNSRLDTIQAAVLLNKLPIFDSEELQKEQLIAEIYTNRLSDVVKTPVVEDGYYSSWAQYTIQLSSREERDNLQIFLRENEIPSMIYYQKPMHRQEAFNKENYVDDDYVVTNRLCETVLSLPFHPYMRDDEVEKVCQLINHFINNEV